MTVMFERTTEPPGAGTVDWNLIRVALEKHKAAKGNYEVVADTDDDGNEIFVMQSLETKSVSTLTEPGVEIPLKDLPDKARSVATRLEARGWTVRAMKSATSHTATLYVNDSKTSDARAGDVRYPEHDQTHYGVSAKLEHEGKVAAAVRAFWDKVGDKSNSFGGAHIFDPVGGRSYEGKATPFEEWVAIFAPKPPSKTKKKAAPAADDGNGEYWNG